MKKIITSLFILFSIGLNSQARYLNKHEDDIHLELSLNNNSKVVYVKGEKYYQVTLKEATIAFNRIDSDGYCRSFYLFTDEPMEMVNSLNRKAVSVSAIEWNLYNEVFITNCKYLIEDGNHVFIFKITHYLN